MFGAICLTLVTAKLQRSGSIPLAIPAMHDTRNDTDQDVLRRLAPSTHAGYLATPF
jgi:hypothetical protein